MSDFCDTFMIFVTSFTQLACSNMICPISVTRVTFCSGLGNPLKLTIANSNPRSSGIAHRQLAVQTGGAISRGHVLHPVFSEPLSNVTHLLLKKVPNTYYSLSAPIHNVRSVSGRVFSEGKTN